MSNRTVIDDQDLIQSAFPEWNAVHLAMTAPNVFRVIADIMFDWLSIVAAMLVLHRFGWWSGPVAIAWIGNRQRALANLLHDAGHRNFAGPHQLNDVLAWLFIAPPLFNSLMVYREFHARHHAWLGDPRGDPDYITARIEPDHGWWRPYLAVLLRPSVWTGSILGHIHLRQTRLSQKSCIVGWWTITLGAMTYCVGFHTAAVFIGVWMLARATVFHAITTFREFCDHFGRRPSGIFNYTRDVSSHSIWRWIIHPRNNGYHLTHHLIPSVPYHRLAQAQRRLLELPAFASTARVCYSYFFGPDAVVREWEVHSGGDRGTA
ncbi:fatty acid desaturase [Burkholderia pseudomallei]|nr:fatty acid desaturase [Burkholderia pseudomallei]